MPAEGGLARRPARCSTARALTLRSASRSGISSSGMRSRTLSLLAVIVLLGVAVALLGQGTALPHRHQAAGLYDASCPLELLAAFAGAGLTAERPEITASIIVLPLAAVPLVGRVRAAARCGVRLRAPPAR